MVSKMNRELVTVFTLKKRHTWNRVLYIIYKVIILKNGFFFKKPLKRGSIIGRF